MSRRVRFLAVDGFNLIRRIFEARKAEVGADMDALVQATVASVRRALNHHQPTHGALVLEYHDRTWRHLLYPAYKANRSETPALLLQSLPVLEQALADLGLNSCAVRNYEADDVIASIARAISHHGDEVVILSTDKVYLQLLDERVSVFDHFAERNLDAAYVTTRYGVNVSQYVDYLALVGDTSNNVKGVPGVGAKTAQALLSQYPDLGSILESIDTSASVARVKAAEAEALRCQQLARLKSDVELGLNLRLFRLDHD